jgi:subtilase family protein
MEAAGAELLDYLPVHGYRVRLAPSAEERVRALPFVAWLGPLPAHLKIEPRLSLRAAAPGEETQVRVILEAGEPVDRVLEAMTGLVPLARPSGQGGAWRVTVTLPAARLGAVLSRLAALPEVEAVEQVRPLRPFNQDAVWVHQSFVGPSPQQTPIFDRGLFGCGQVVGIADTGQDYDLCYFRDVTNGPPPFFSCGFAPCSAGAPAPNRRKDIIYYNWSGTPTGDDDTCPLTIGGSGHGTHTSGSIAGDNSPYAACTTFASPGRNGGDGQAPGAKLVVQEMGDGLEYLNDLGGTLWNLTDVAYKSGARIHSDSWAGACHDIFGSCIPGCTMPYDSFARDADLAMWTYTDLLLVLAAGNAGECPPPISVGTPAIAKSPVSVGSVGHGANAATPSTFSSRGPVFDGRLKPTVAAQGEATVSAASDANPGSNNCATCSLNGTSMATPTTAGLAALVREYYTAGFYASGIRDAARGFTPSAALMKATLIDGAVALGAAAPSPDFDSGYGRVLLGTTLAFSASPFRLRVDDHREGLATGSVITHAYDVAAGTPLRATLVWSDYPAALNAASARVNELKLEVIDPSGNVWFQTIDDGTDAPKQTMNASDAHDTRNVEERLVFGSPAAGRWVVRVRGVDVPWGPQPFALVVRGDLTDCPAPAAPLQPTLTTPADQQVQVSWGAVAGAQTYNVYRSLRACPGGPWIPVASGTMQTSFLDTTDFGGVSYSYYVTAASDASSFCESARSPCASVVTTGDCVLASEFGGVRSAASAGLPSCSIALSWDPAIPYCGTDVRYNVYRGTSSGFTPGPGNRVARCVIGTGYTDSVDLADGVTYYYVVRAEDATVGHGGPCRGGNEDANVAMASAAPDGPTTFGTWRDNAGDSGAAKLVPGSPWANAASGGNLGPRVYTVASFGGMCADLTTPVVTLADPGQGPQLSFATKHDLEYDPFGFFGAEGSLGQVEIATGPGFGNWTRVELTPDYPALVEFPFNDCPTTAGVDTYFSGESASYSTYTASLANWAGGDVKIRFHASGDHFNPSGNWWIDDVVVSQAMAPGACTNAPAGPPPIPDGGPVSGVPVRVSRSGSSLLVTWDATRCQAAAVNIYLGTLGDFSTFTSGACNLPPTGSAIVSAPDNAWLVVAATDGAATDGSYGRHPSGAERTYAGGSLVCPAITQHVTNNGCP